MLTALSSLLVINAHFARNDSYLLLFTTLAVYCLVRFVKSEQVFWLYAVYGRSG